MQMLHTARPDDYPPPDEVFTRNVRIFFDMVAPTLRTLHIALYSLNLPIYMDIFRPKNSRTYPRLEEIAYRASRRIGQGLSTPLEGGGGIIPTRTGPITFPRLRRLWFNALGSSLDDTERDFLNDLAIACPGLTHLRLHEESRYTLQRVLERFMRWHGVKLGESSLFTPQDPLDDDDDDWECEWVRAMDVVAVLQTNALLGFPNLQRLIIDLRPEGRSRRPRNYRDRHIRRDLPIPIRENLHAVAKRRHEVVVRWRRSCTRALASLPFVGDLFERSVGGDKDLWHPENELFQEHEAERWQPIRVSIPGRRYGYRDPLRLTYRANILVSSPKQEGRGLLTGEIASPNADDSD